MTNDFQSQANSLADSLAAALACHRAGQWQRAEQMYRGILATRPDHAQALHLLGVLQHQLGNYSQAIESIERAIGQNPEDAIFHSNLGESYRAAGESSAAIASYRRALRLNPDFAGAYYNLGNALKDQQQLEQAIDCYQRAVQLQPDYPAATNNLGNAWMTLGNALKEQGKLDEAADCLRRSLTCKPDSAEAHYYLGNILSNQGKVDEAVASYSRALELMPDLAEAHFNLGSVYKEQGKLDEAIASYRRALQAKPDFAAAHSNVAYALTFSPGYDARSIYEEHCRWNRRFAEPLASLIQPHANDRSPDRRLRIGYVSPNFNDHVVGRNLLPLLREHDHRQFEIFCYAQVSRPDDFTARFQGYADTWRNIVGMTDESLAQRVRRDGIDILVDLTLHMADSRLLVFARKPAPVQVTFAGYPGTTGLTTIDYRLTDRHLDPPGESEDCYSEASIRLPDSFWCYDPISDKPAVNRLPALTNGYVTFGCLNNFCKVNASMLTRWADVLNAVPNSRLLLRAAEGSSRHRILDCLAQDGITADRLSFVDRMPRPQYLQLYHQIDVGLDTLPYHGHTTSLDSLWLGVPVVTLIGQTVVGRAGVCQLMNLGLEELIAETPEQFVSIAAHLAGDLPRLSQLRETLRGRMQKSPLMDAPRFAGNIESAYRQMWRRWCEQSP